MRVQALLGLTLVRLLRFGVVHFLGSLGPLFGLVVE